MSTKVVRSFRDLEVWQSAMQVAVMAHEIANQFPAEQRYALGAQIRRSSTSIPSNIAEGHAHRGMRSFLRHVRIALGSRAELDTQLEIASRLNLVGQQELAAMAPASWSPACAGDANPRRRNDDGHRRRRRVAHSVNAQTPNPAPRTPHPEPRAPRPRAPSPESQAPSPKPQVPSPEPIFPPATHFKP